MSNFISRDKKPVTLDDDPHNTIFIKSGVDRGTHGRVMSKIAAIRSSTGNNMEATIDIGAYQLALLVNFVVGWAGPDFEEDGKLLDCTPANIERLSMEAPLVDEALVQIVELWNGTQTKSADPNFSRRNGGARSKAKAKAT